MKSLKSRSKRRISLLVAILAAVLLSAWGLIAVGYADEVPTAPYTLDVGYLGFAYGDQIPTDHTATRPESKVWWNDGFWWGSMWNDTAAEFHIYRLDWGEQTWHDTGVAIDDRPGSRSDVLWDETAGKLYVVSYYKKSNPAAVNDPVNWARLYRFTYDEAIESYSLDSLDITDYVTINEDRTNSLVVDKDSTGTLWATYVSQERGSPEYEVFVTATDGSDDNWVTPVSLYDIFPEASVAVDDLSSIVSFNNHVGLMWTNQLSGTLNFALKSAGTPIDSGWTHEVVTITGEIDDHLSLKANGAGQLFAAIKTNAVISDTGETLIEMVARDTNGDFSSHTYSLAEDNDTRPIVVVDESNEQVYVFVTGKPGGSFICYKTAAIITPLSSMAFAPGDCGEPFISDSIYDRIDSATSSKAPFNDVTGLVVLASDDHNGNVYVHNVIGEPPPVITQRSPGPGATNVPADATVMATFSNHMNNATITGASFTLESSAGPVAGSVSYTDTTRTAMFTPASLFESGTTYTATVTTGVQDIDGKSLFETETWSFSTGNPLVAFSAENYSVNEDAGTGTITVTMNGPASAPVTVDYATTTGGDATVDVDYTAVSGTLTFDPGETSQSFDIPIIDDGSDEVNETVNLELSNPAGADLGALSTAVLTIVDDEGTPTLQFQPTSFSVTEDGGAATVTISLSPSASDPVTVTYTTSDGTATAGSDYTSASGTLTFLAGETSQTFTVPISDDAVDEPDETVNLALTDKSANANLGVPGTTATLTIVDNDAQPLVAFEAESYSFDEDAGTATIGVALSAPSAFNVTVDFATVSGSASAGSDYTPTAQTLSFSPGETNKTVTVPILDDALNEPNETVNLALSNPTNSQLGPISESTLTIIDDDPMPTVQFSVADYNVDEDGGSVTIQVTLSGPSGQTTAVDYATSDGTATAGSDYTATSGTLSFDVGDTSQSFTVPILDDNLGEPDETITLTLSNPDDVTLGTPAVATVTITDDDVFLNYLPITLSP